MQHLSPHTIRSDRDHLSFFHDSRSANISQIEEFLGGATVQRLQQSIRDKAYVVLGGDGLFVAVAKQAHVDDAQILGINFGSKGFLLHDRSVFDRETLQFDQQEYPILHADVQIGDEHIHGYAFNEVYITRAGDASSIQLSLTHRSKRIERYIGDGLMISTPAGSTGWSRSYGGMVLPHDANLNVITPLGKMSPSDFQSMVITDKGRIRIHNDTTRVNPIDILVDNRRIISMESRPIELTIERSARGVQLLVESSYREQWDARPYRELGFK